MPLNLFYTMVQKSQNDQKLKSKGGGGGPALRQDPLIWVFGHFWLFCTIV